MDQAIFLSHHHRAAYSEYSALRRIASCHIELSCSVWLYIWVDIHLHRVWYGFCTSACWGTCAHSCVVTLCLAWRMESPSARVARRHVCDERWRNITRSVKEAPAGTLRQPTWCRLPSTRFANVVQRVPARQAENFLLLHKTVPATPCGEEHRHMVSPGNVHRGQLLLRSGEQVEVSTSDFGVAALDGDVGNQTRCALPPHDSMPSAPALQ